MTRATTLIASLMTLLFAVAICLPRLLPYQDGGLTALLTPPDDCAAPCWLGLRPGVSTLSEGGQLLQASAWLKDFQVISPATAFLRFSDIVPAVTRGKLDLWASDQGIVSRITLSETKLAFSDIQLALGAPQRVFFNHTYEFEVNHLIAIYTAYNLSVSASLDMCPISQDIFWSQPHKVVLTIGDWQTVVNEQHPAYAISSTELDPQRWATQLRQMQLCQP